MAMLILFFIRCIPTLIHYSFLFYHRFIFKLNNRYAFINFQINKVKRCIKLRNILAIHTGGTISMSESGGIISENEENPLKIEGHLDDDVNISEIYPIKKPSPHITIDDMDEIKSIIEESKGQYEGYVITHGTDTLEETAFFLDLTLNMEQPVIITGAMRSSNELGSDGMYNYLSGLRAALSA